jgi:hypothetical protein
MRPSDQPSDHEAVTFLRGAPVLLEAATNEAGATQRQLLRSAPPSECSATLSPMSTARGPVRVVQQLDLQGGISVVELHGVGARTRTNTLRGLTSREAAVAVHDARTSQGAEIIAGSAGVLDRPCPRCGTVGHPEDVFGFRFIRRQRRRQSWCRSCRSSSPPRRALPEDPCAWGPSGICTRTYGKVTRPGTGRQ